MTSGALAGLPDARVDPEVADQLLGGREAVDVPDRGDQGRGGRDVDPGDRHQPFDLGALEGVLGELAVDVRDLGGEEIDLAQARFDGVALIVGEFELGEPPRGRVCRTGQLIGGRPLRLRTSTAEISFFGRVR